MYSACQVKGPFENVGAKDNKPQPFQPREKIEIDPPNGLEISKFSLYGLELEILRFLKI